MRGGLIRRASVASGSRHCCRMRRKRLIRPTEGAGICRPDKTRKRRIRHLAPLPDAARAPYPAYRSQYNQFFFTNSDFSFIGPKPSILQSMLWSPSTRRMFFTLVPIFSIEELPFTFRSLMMVTLSPSASRLPLASLTISSSLSCAGSASFHS